MRKHLGSTVALVIGITGFLGALARPSGWLVAGPIIILGALAYRSCKKRKLGEVENSLLRKALETTAIIAIILATILPTNLKDLIATDPVPTLVIPLYAIVAYAFVALKKYPRAGVSPLGQ